MLKNVLRCYFLLGSFFFFALDVYGATGKGGAPRPERRSNDMIVVNIEIGGTVFTADLENTKAAVALASRFPMTVEMRELNRQEKFYNLPENLPISAPERPATIRAGDIMCWSGNGLVLFYTTFANSYGGYVRLGKIRNPSGLAAALGSGSVRVTWSLAK